MTMAWELKAQKATTAYFSVGQSPPTWFSVLGYFEDGNLELNIEYWSRWEVFKSRQIGFRRAHFNPVQWYLWNFSNAIHWGSEIRCNTLNFRHLESFPHPELSSQEFYNCRRESTVGGLLNEKKLWFVLKYSFILKFRKMQAKRDLTKIIYTYMYSVVFMDLWVTFFGPPCIKNVSGETTKGHRLSQVSWCQLLFRDELRPKSASTHLAH